MRWNCYKILIWICVVTSSAINVYSQEYDYIFNETENTKLQNHYITSLVQDLNGFLWVGTNLGLYRYDGYHFTSINISSKHSQLDFHVSALLVENENLWIGSNEGIHILNTNNYSIKNLMPRKKDTSRVPLKMVTKLYLDKQNTIWVGFNSNQISRYLGKNNFKNFTISNLPSDYELNDIYETYGNIFILKLTSKKTKNIKILRGRVIDNKIYFKVLKEIENNSNALFNIDYEIYLVNKNNIYNYDSFKDEFKLKPYTLKNNLVLSGSSYFQKNTIYLGGNKGSFHKFNFLKNTHLVTTTFDLNNSFVTNFLFDKSGMLWVGTTSGLYKLKKQKKLFQKHLFNNQLNKENSIRAIIQDEKENIYAINQTDLYKYNFNSKQFENLNWSNKLFSTPYELCENTPDSILVGFQGGEIKVYNKKTNILTNYFQSKNNNILKSSILKLVKDKHSILWIGTLNGLGYYNEKSNSLITNINLNNDIFFNKNIINDIKIDDNDNIWIGANTGLYQLKIDYSKKPIVIKSLKINRLPYHVHSILINKNIIWLTTKFNGLLKYNSSANTISVYNEATGLSINNTYSILLGEKNELWLGSIYGLSRFDTNQKEFINFYDYNGLAGNQTEIYSQLKTKTGQLFFGGKNGITSFSPSHIKTDSTSYPLNLVSINWYNTSKKSNTNKIKINNKYLTELKIPYNNAFVSFEFSLADYFKPTKNQFKYRLIGFLNEWKVLKNSNKLTYTNLPPGNYFLEVFALSTDKNWNKKTIRVPIIVNQIYYKRWWFLIGCFIILGLLMFFIRKDELGHILQMEKLRMRIARDLHDELGSVLTGIAIKSDLLLEKIKLTSKKKILKIISEQSRNAVDSLSDIVWAIDSKNNSMQELSNRMESSMYQLLTPLNISYSFQPLQNFKSLEINQDVRQHVYLIFKEAITNILKHSKANFVFVSMVKEKSSIILTIKDNGLKYNKKKSKLNGNGLKNIALRAKKIKGEINFTNDKGFTVELIFPYTKK